MSHIVTIKTQVRDAAAVTAACNRLGLPPPIQRQVQLFSGTAEGLAVELPGWQYPVVCELASGTLKFDNYGGAWGDQQELDRFLQAYAVERAKHRSPPPRPYGHRAAAGRRLDQAHHPGRRRCRMSKIIEVIVAPDGQVKVETKGFTGSCVPGSQRVPGEGARRASVGEADGGVLCRAGGPRVLQEGRHHD